VHQTLGAEAVGGCVNIHVRFWRHLQIIFRSHWLADIAAHHHAGLRQIPLAVDADLLHPKQRALLQRGQTIFDPRIFGVCSGRQFIGGHCFVIATLAKPRFSQQRQRAALGFAGLGRSVELPGNGGRLAKAFFAEQPPCID
jgi:hypothetical protein